MLSNLACQLAMCSVTGILFVILLFILVLFCFSVLACPSWNVPILFESSTITIERMSMPVGQAPFTPSVLL